MRILGVSNYQGRAIQKTRQWVMQITLHFFPGLFETTQPPPTTDTEHGQRMDAGRHGRGVGRYIPPAQRNQAPVYRAPAIRIPARYPVADLAERTTEWFEQAHEWIDTQFFPVYGDGHPVDCRHCGFHFDAAVERDVIGSLFDDTPRDQSELRMISRTVGFMRAMYPRPQVGTYYIMMREHSENPLAFSLMILMLETLQRAFTRKGIRTRWWVHLDEQHGTGRYEHPHAWIKLDGYYSGFTRTEKAWVDGIIARHGIRSLPVNNRFSVFRNGERVHAQENPNGPYRGDEVYDTDTRFGLMNRLSDGRIPVGLNVGGYARIVAESFMQYLEPIGFQWGRTVQVFVWGLPDRTCFCHAAIGSDYEPRDLQLQLRVPRVQAAAHEMEE